MKTKQTVFQALRFVVVGAAATALHWGLYLLLMRRTSANMAYAIGYALSFLFNFLATAWFTFRTPPSWRNLIGMAGAHGVNFLLHMLLLNLFLWTGVPKAWTPLPVYAIAVPTNFLLVRLAFLQRKNKKTKRWFS